MAFITQSDDTKCYTCGKQCINVEFCSEGGSYGEGVSLSRNIRVKIIANPEFWGFSGVLISGYATYTNGYYDYFDGFDEDHIASKTCNGITYGPFRNEQRPDVIYRSVYDPDTGISKHYNGLSSNDIERGGAEVYLIDRAAVKTSDTSSCDNLDPTSVFKKFPHNFGFAPKINFNTEIYKNLSGAWRLTSLENCYPSNQIYKPPGYLIDCSGEEKQNILSEYRRYQNYEPTRPRASGESSYYNYTSGCRPDGSIAGKYTGYFADNSSIFRSSDFIEAHLSYGGNAASGLHSGMTIGIKTETSGNIFNNIYTIFDVDHSAGSYTSVKFVGTSSGNPPLTPSMPTGVFNLDIGESGHWIAFNTHDPQTCCGLAAYGVSDEHKKITGDRNYHTDFRRVFNNPKNLRQSNRLLGNRTTYDLFDDTDTVLSYVGDDYYDNFLLPSGDDVYFYYSIGQNWINRKDWRYPSVSGVEISGQTYGYPLLYDADNIPSDTDVFVATGDALMSGYPVFQRDLSYYGNFFETDFYDNVLRIEQQINRGKSDNATCYSKHATLEIFPDCLTQYDYVDKNCSGTKEYVYNSVPRLAFVYRGCDFNDDCSFDNSGLPLGAWENQNGIPTGIDDLKRQLAGQEIHMFVNLGRAWGGRKPGSPCRCDCGDENGDNFNLPTHSFINSPMTFPSFPNFDLNPSGYGCYDEIYQAKKAIDLEGETSTCDNRCDPLPSSSYACLPRQPYTTYGYIMNLCGKETKNRRNVITEAFAKLHQDKTYTNANPTNDVTEPMYWNIIAPDPAPVYGGGVWSSGSQITQGDGGGKFIQTAGSGYGYWGLADYNNTVSAPYFTTMESYHVCCQETGYYVEYNETGTWQNVLNTHNGWPTNAVPFLIELETDDSCTACPTTVMKGTNLNLEISGLNSDYIFNQDFRYGHNYCPYGSILDTAKARQKPNFSCQDGFDLDYCSVGLPVDQVYSNFASGNTCDCLGVFNTILYPVYVKNTEVVAGWTSNPDGGASGLLEITNCWNSGSAYFDWGEGQAKHRGYRVFAEFKLGCQTHDRLNGTPSCPVLETTDYVSALWTNPSLCSHSYPAKIGSDQSLDLQTNLYFVVDPLVPVFRKFSETALREREFYGSKMPGQIPCINSGDFTENGVFGVCDGDTVYGYGCYVSNPVEGPAGFYGCINPILACSGKTECNTCPSQYNDPDGIICSCGAVTGIDGAYVSGDAVGWGGIAPRERPSEWTLNTCYCDCKTPTLANIYLASGGGLVLTSGDNCRDIYWMSTNATESPILLGGCGINDTEGFGDKERNIPSTDYYNWSQGVNALIEGVKYELYEPILGESTETNNFCNQLLRDMTVDLLNPSRDIIYCENTGCLTDNNVNSKTCGEPIYFSGVFDGVAVRKKKCSPEVAIVTKIECLEDNKYKLHISREYHEHDRTWYEKIVIEQNEEFIKICVPVNVGAYEYNDGSTSGCFTMDYSLLADTVMPVTNPPCSIHPSSGLYVNQDYQYLDPGFPSGSNVWNYFNLFYSQNYLPTVDNGTLIPSIGRDENGSPLCTGTPLEIQNTGTILTESDYEQPAGYNGIFATTEMHSCVQDSVVCGGDLWCNKMFFPRHSYKQNTRIAPFGSPSICTSNAKIDNGIGFGYYENNEIIPSAKDLLSEQNLRFVDFCNDRLVQLAMEDIDIDDNIIIVEDYLPLIGVLHPGFRSNLDTKSCTFAGNGCQDIIPTHNDATILQGIHQPKTFYQNSFDSMGYYLDKAGVSHDGNGNLIAASGTDGCLFNPFKILIDVECSLNRIERKHFPSDDPTLIEGVQEWPSYACKGTKGNIQCICDSTICNYNYGPKKAICQPFLIIGGVGSKIDGSYPSCESAECQEETGTGEPGDPVIPCSYSGVELQGSFIIIEDFDFPYAAVHPDVLGESEPINGIIESGDCCGEGDAICYNPTDGDWRLNSCNGKYYKVEDTISVPMWNCNGVQYIWRHPKEIYDNPDLYKCPCDDITSTLCDSSIKCSDFSTCGCNSVNGFISPPNIDLLEEEDEMKAMMSACDCRSFTTLDKTPCKKSLVKWTITESS